MRRLAQIGACSVVCLRLCGTDGFLLWRALNLVLMPMVMSLIYASDTPSAPSEEIFVAEFVPATFVRYFDARLPRLFLLRPAVVFSFEQTGGACGALFFDAQLLPERLFFSIVVDALA